MALQQAIEDKKSAGCSNRFTLLLKRINFVEEGGQMNHQT